MNLPLDVTNEIAECSSSQLCPRYSRQPAGCDRLTLWFPTFRTSWTNRDIRQDGNPEALLHLTLRGTQAGLDFNPSRMVNPGTIELASLNEVMWAVREAWRSVRCHVEPRVDVESARITRLDLARDFSGALDPGRLILGMAQLRRPYGGDPMVYFDQNSHQAKSLAIGSKSRRVILYDKALQSPTMTMPGALRWELQARPRLLRRSGIALISDLEPKRVRLLTENEWRWSQMETPITSVPDLFEFISSTELPPGRRPGIAWAIQQVQHGDELSSYSQRQLSQFVKKHGLPLALGAAPLGCGAALTEHLDWNSGSVISTMGSERPITESHESSLESR